MEQKKKYIPVHDDGPCANGKYETPLVTIGGGSYCPVCKIHPDMQSIALILIKED